MLAAVAILGLFAVGAAAAVPVAPAADSVGALQAGANASLTVSPTPAEPKSVVTFDARESSGGTSDPIVQCAFDVDGDGEVEATNQDCLYQHTFDSPADYEASVTVTTESGATATDTATVTVQESALTARITIDPGTPRAGEIVTLSGSNSTASGGSIESYRWRIDGVATTGERFTRQFDTAGQYAVSLTVTAEDGATNTTDRTLDVVENEPPSATVSVRPRSPAVGETVVLDASESTEPDGTIAGYRWDLDGDGAIDRESTTAVIETTFSRAGDIEVAVEVVDDLGATDRASRSIAVQSRTTTAASTGTDTPVGGSATAIGGAPGAGSGVLGVVDALDFGLVPLVPDWLLVLLAIAGAALAVVRRDTVRSKVSEYRDRVRTREFRKNMSTKGVAFVAKSIVKRGFRRAGDLVEFATESVGEAFEWIGRAIKGVGQRVAGFLRKLGG